MTTPSLIRVVDVETCGLEPGDGVVEVGWCDVARQADGTWRVSVPDSQLINPGRRIPPAMSAIHHVTDDMVAGAPALADFLPELRADGVVFAAHYAAFELLFIGDALGPSADWLCSWKGAVHLAPQAPTHSNQGLRYYLKLSVSPELANPPHRAGPDAYVTACLIHRMLGKATVEELVEISRRPAILPYLTFGEWSMQPIENVPDDYLAWIINQGPKRAPDARGKRKGFDEDVRATAYHHLNLRRRGEST